MVELANLVVSGVISGCILALLAMGYSIVFRTTGLFDLAQGGYIVLGGLLSYTFARSVGLPLPVALAAAVATIGVCAGTLYRFVIQPGMGRLSRSNLLMVMVGVLIVSGGVALVGWGATPFTLKAFSGTPSFELLGVRVATQGVWIVGLLLVSVASITVVLRYTGVGRALRALAESDFSARVVGVHTVAFGAVAYGGTAGLAALAGGFVLPFQAMSAGSVITYGLLGLVAATLGGLGSITGAVVGGLVLGVGQALMTGYVSNVYGNALALGLLMLVLAVRPEGFLSRARGRRRDTRARDLGRIPIVPRLGRKFTATILVCVIAVGAVVPTIGSLSAQLPTLNLVGIFGLAALGLGLLSGTAGQINLGQAAFMAVGGFTAAALALRGTPWILCIGAGVVASLIVATLFGYLVRNLSGLYLAAVTLAFTLMVEQVASGLGITGKAEGLVGVPSISLMGFAFDTDERFYYLIWCVVAVAGALVAGINSGMYGKLLRSLHGDATATAALGFDVARAKLLVLLFSSSLAAIAGALYAGYFRLMTPDMVGVTASLSLIVMVVVGGAGTVSGALVGALVLTFLPKASQGVATWFQVIEGGMLILVLSYARNGIYGVLVGLLSPRRLLDRIGRAPFGLPRASERRLASDDAQRVAPSAAKDRG